MLGIFYLKFYCEFCPIESALDALFIPSDVENSLTRSQCCLLTIEEKEKGPHYVFSRDE